MIAVIVLLDQIVWRPVIAWAEKFKMEQVESADVPRSWFLNVIQGSRGLVRLRKRVIRPLQERLTMHFVRQHDSAEDAPPVPWKIWTGRAIAAIAVVAVLYAVTRAIAMLTGLDGSEYHELLTGAGATFLRVIAALVIGAAWTIPAGVAIGFNPKLARIAQPLAQIAASVPATALFPIVLLVLIRIGGGLGLGSIVLLLLGTQWYILFNVIAGAMAIPTDLREASDLFKFNRAQRWRKLILPGIFPYLITGMVTASGGAWNASIVAEYFRLKDKTYTTVGLGATISRASDAGNFDLLLASTIVMAIVVVTVNRLVWRRMYRLAATRYTLET
jgi:NitT/TauT family transport system permease protein